MSFIVYDCVDDLPLSSQHRLILFFGMVICH